MNDEPASPEEAANRQAADLAVAGVVARLEAETREQAERLRVAYDELDAARATTRDREQTIERRVQQADQIARERDEARGNWNAALTARDTWAGRAGRAETALHAVLAALRAGVPLPPEVLDDVTRLAAEAYEQSRADRAELVRELDETRTRLAAVEAELVRTLSPVVDGRTLGEWRSVGVTEPWTASAIRTRADVEARLSVCFGERTKALSDSTVALMRSVMADDRPGPRSLPFERSIVDLVCAVLGVPHAG